MKTQVIIGSEELNQYDLAQLMQAIRDCEQTHFKDKQIMIFVDVPELTSAQIQAIITGIKPGFVSLIVGKTR